MSLWTPYVEDRALDLTVSAKKPPEPSTSHHVYHYGLCQDRQPIYVPPAYCIPPPVYTVSSSQISPVSISSGSYDDYPQAAPEENRDHQSIFEDMNEVDTLSDDPDFQEFERDALKAMAEKNGGSLLGNNPRMRRAVKSTNQNASDDAYRRQRERNNFAAKQSRDRRKLREIHLALKVAYLRGQVGRLSATLAGRSCGKCQHSCEC